MHRTSSGPLEHSLVFLHALPMAAYVCDADGSILAWNRHAVALWGAEPKRDADRRFTADCKVLAPDGGVVPPERTVMAEALRTGKAVRAEARFERPDGSRFRAALHAGRLCDDAGEVIGALGCFEDVEDVVEEGPAEALARVPDRWLREVLEAVPAALYTTDAEGRVTFYNRAAAELAGREPLLGHDQWCVTWRLYWPDGRPMPHDQCPMAVALRENRPVRGAEAIVERPDGTRVPILPFPMPLRDATGALVGAVNMLVDITERQAAETARCASEERLRRLSETLEQRIREEVAERESAQAALLQAQKLEAIGQLTGGVAHDFNNLLTAIIGNLDLLGAEIANEAWRQRIDAATRAAQRGAKLTQQLLAYARKQHMAQRPVDVNAVVAGMDDMLRRSLGGLVQVEGQLDPDLWPALTDPTQLELVILNLAINARDAMPVGGTLRIETRNGRLGDARLPQELAPGDYVEIAVTDTGMGMPPEIIQKAMEPFFTTKEVGKGSGLGLSQVYGVAKQSGGTVRLRSAVDIGTTVEIWLPRAQAAAVAGEADRSRLGPQPRRRETVLVVDDDADVRNVAVAVLEAAGYQVLAAETGPIALAILARDERIELAVVDYAMPRMPGNELVRIARQRHPDIAVVYATGYADPQRITLDDGDMVLPKPYRAADLLQAAREGLKRPSGARDGTNVVPFNAAAQR